MSLTPFEMAKLLLIIEEGQNRQSALSIQAQQEKVIEENQQKVVAKSSEITLGKNRYVNIVRDTPFIATGLLFKTSKKVHVKLMKLQTPTEFKNFRIEIDNQVYMAGDFAYFSKIGMAYYTPDDGLYTIEIADFDSSEGLELKIDSGLTVNFYTIIATITE